MNYSLWEILNMAGYAMWIIVAFSVLSVAVALERVVVQWGYLHKARALHETVTRCLSRGAVQEGRSACERSHSTLADVYLVGYERLGRTKRQALEAAVNRERVRTMADLTNRMWILGTIGATAPFVGLFGTVVGIMGAFHTIGETGENEFNKVAGPIAEALIATAAGIIVAVIAVIFYNYFSKRASRIAIEVRMFTDEFLELLDEVGTGEGDEGEADGDREAA